MTKTNIRAVSAIILTAALIALGPLTLFIKEKFMPVKSLDGIELGMSEVDVTLAFGRLPDHTYEEDDGEFKYLSYATPRGLRVELLKLGDIFEVYNICTEYPIIKEKGVSWDNSTEESVVKKLGSPSHVSISEDGTKKYMSFSKVNLAFLFQGSKIKEACVTKALPIIFSKEYGS